MTIYVVLGWLIFSAVSSFPAHAQREGCDKMAFVHGKKDPAMPEYWMGLGMVTMDMNKDGHKDLFCSAFGPKTTFVYFGGQALFDTTADLELHGGAELVTGDFNGDGLTDLAARLRMYKDANGVIHPDSVLIYMGVRDSVYALETTPRHVVAFPLCEKTPSYGSGYLGEDLFASDLDGDGSDELIAATTFSFYDRHGGIAVWHYPRGDSSDTLSFPRTNDAILGASMRSIQVGDVNGDGIGDFVVATTEKDVIGGGYPPPGARRIRCTREIS